MAWLDKTLKKMVHNMDPVRQGQKLWNTITEKSQDFMDNVSGKKAADRLNKQSLEAWNMQNEYNTPANQVQRMLDAGLNPNLFYSQGNVINLIVIITSMIHVTGITFLTKRTYSTHVILHFN